MRFVFTLSFAILTATVLLAANTESPNPSGVESLGRELLEGLTPDSLKQSITPPRPAENDPQPAARFNDLGVDIGQPSGALPLVRVGQGMRHAESLLAESKPIADAGSLQHAGVVQQQVVEQLDKLIAELSKQCQGGQCQPGDQPPKPSESSQNKPGKSGDTAGLGKTAARDSTDRLDQSNAQPVDKGDIEAMVKDLWGHLPERSREQMMQSFSEEFLPKYELEIEQYYRRLSEENDENRAP